MFPGFQANPIWSPAFQQGPSFRTPEPAAERLQSFNSGEMWVEEHFAQIMEDTLTRKGDMVGLLMGLAGALKSRAIELRYTLMSLWIAYIAKRPFPFAQMWTRFALKQLP